MEITLNSLSVDVINECRKADGSMMKAKGLATPAHDTGSELKVTFLPSWIRWLPVGKADYWVLQLDQNYQTALVGTSTSTTTLVLGAEVQAPKVLAESSTFVAVQNTENPELISGSAPASAPQKTNRVATLATEPKSYGNLYLGLAAILVLAIALCIGVEVNKQHPKNVIAGILLLFFVLILLYLYQTVLFGQVIVT